MVLKNDPREDHFPARRSCRAVGQVLRQAGRNSERCGTRGRRQDAGCRRADYGGRQSRYRRSRESRRRCTLAAQTPTTTLERHLETTLVCDSLDAIAHAVDTDIDSIASIVWHGGRAILFRASSATQSMTLSIDDWDSLDTPTDEWFAVRCDHTADSSRGSWWILSDRRSCRHCGVFFSTWLTRQATEATQTNTKTRWIAGLTGDENSEKPREK